MNRREMLLIALQGANPEYVASALRTEESEGAAAAELESAVLFSSILRTVQPKGDTSWLAQRLAAIEYRGGPRSKCDEAYLKLRDAKVDLHALTDIIREKQLEVASEMFCIHAGSGGPPFEAMPELCFKIHYAKLNDDCETIQSTEMPNWIDEAWDRYVGEWS